MPNTLIHIAIQAPISRAIFSKVEIPWILAGTIIPDIPWILQRIITTSAIDPYQLRLYCTVQASLAFCFFLCIALASFSQRPTPVFLLLAVNCLLHLLLDALQIKWGNGVHLFSPFSWYLTSYGLIWPENIFGYCLSALAIIFLVIKSKTIVHEGLVLRPPKGKRRGFAVLALMLYFTLPLFFMDQVEKSNASHINTLRHSEGRTGKVIELDRAYYSAKNKKITIFSGESFSLTGNTPDHSGAISLKGKFTAPQAITSSMFHKHNDYRNDASYIGLLLAISIWSSLLLIQRKKNKDKKK